MSGLRITGLNSALAGASRDVAPSLSVAPAHLQGVDQWTGSYKSAEVVALVSRKHDVPDTTRDPDLLVQLTFNLFWEIHR